MENNKLNISQTPLTNYPVPEIPVEEAWAGMNQLLDTNMPGDKKGGRKYLLLLLLLIFISSVVYFSQSGKPAKTTVENKTANNNTTETVQGASTTEDNNAISSNNAAATPNKNNSSSVGDDKNNSPAALSSRIEKKAVANTKEKQQTPAALNIRAANKMENTGTGNLSNSVMANNTAALAGDKISVSVNETTGKGNSQQDALTANKDLNQQKAKAAVLLNNNPVKNSGGEKTTAIGVSEKMDAKNKENIAAIRNTSSILNESPGKTNQSPVNEPSVNNNKVINGDNAGNNATLNKISTGVSTTQQQEPVTTTAQESLQNTTAAKKTSKAVKQLGINYGLQWNIALPLQGTKNYFSGTNGSSQPYIILLPDVWVNKKIGKNQELLFTLYFSHLFATGNKQLTTVKGQWSIVDTTTVVKSLLLSKTSGFSLGLQYNYNISKRWGLGAGINYNFLSRALIDEKTTGFYTGTLLSDVTTVAQKNGSNWLYLNPTFLTGKFELSYYFGKVKIGTNILLPLSNISSTPGNSVRPVNGQIFLRWRLKK